MNTIAIALSDERLLKLQKLANDLNVSIEELVLIGASKTYSFRELNAESDRQLIEFQCYTKITALFGGNCVIPYLHEENIW